MLLATASQADEQPCHPAVPVLVYHRFATTADDTMTVRVDSFEAHLRTIEQAGFRIVPLADVLAWHRGGQNVLPERSVSISIDDGHRSVYEVLRPLLRARQSPIPITLFIYPSAISNASYALTWDQLRIMRQDGFFTIESHTYWHPNFHTERAQHDAPDYRAFVRDQLERARARIQSETGSPATLLAWPFGIHDAELEVWAVQAGHAAAFTIDARPVTRAEYVMALPRYLITDRCGEECIREILRRAERQDD
nr:polysaccharide deacetylase family protein [Cupriavidus sp. YR651]